MPNKPTLNPAHAQQLPRVNISPTTNNHRHPTRSKHLPTTDNQCNAVMSLSTGDLEENKSMIKVKGKDKDTWLNSCSKKLGRLAQGIRDIKGTAWISFIHHLDVTKDKKLLIPE